MASGWLGILRFGTVDDDLLPIGPDKGEVDAGELVVRFPLVHLLLYSTPPFDRVGGVLLELFRCRLTLRM